MSTINTPGDLSVGDLITVHSWRDDEQPSSWQESDPFTSMFGTMRGATRQTALCGEVLEVKAVQLPYLVVKAGLDLTLTIDTRLVVLMTISAEYARAKLAGCQPSAGHSPLFAIMGRKGRR